MQGISVRDLQDGRFPGTPQMARALGTPRSKRSTGGRITGTGTPTRSQQRTDRIHPHHVRTPRRTVSTASSSATNASAAGQPLSPAPSTHGRSPRKTAGTSSVSSPRANIISSRNADAFLKSRLGVAGISPGGGGKRGRVKERLYDRFVPSEDAIDKASSQFNLRDKTDRHKLKIMDPEALAYQEQVAKACGVALDKRILAFNAEPPAASRHEIKTSWNRPLRNPNSTAAKRRVKTEPEKVLDAPGLLDDYYLNLLDWSTTNMLAIALENTVYLWNGTTGVASPLRQSSRQDTYISSLQWAPDGSHLAVGLSEGEIEIWSLESMKKMRTMRGRASRVGVLSWDKNVLSSGARDGSIWNHDVRQANHRTAQLMAHESDVCGLKWRPDGMFLASGGNDNQVVIWDARSSLPKFTKQDHTAAVKALAWCPWQLNTLATGGGSHDRTVHFWNVATAGKLASVETGSQVTSIIWSTEYKEFFTAHGFPNHHLSIWKYPSLTKIGDLEGHESRVLHTALSPDGQTVATGASDENLKFWKVWERRGKGKCAGSRGEAKGKEKEDELVDAYRRLAIR
ncbi:WD40 repeat-containing protein [Fimicolochytrium jonesii]|uniref:WD40 repeat-containing protein n=1 Tax=Fimicolochytrium jonesii TaxID=1396493 RepID=UPI0022FF23E7|nr:WD40 repeat-containing protein [Fimicolochytrium jonesii]KAI8818765.1 WD40 repeat-containing protein [Fimicolochytrium jonesii]